MVVKNVARLDMAKLLSGPSALTAIATVNFKLQRAEVGLLLLPFGPWSYHRRAQWILKGQLRPAAVDLLNPAAGAAWECRRLLALRARTARPPWNGTSANSPIHRRLGVRGRTAANAVELHRKLHAAVSYGLPMAR